MQDVAQGGSRPTRKIAGRAANRRHAELAATIGMRILDGTYLPGTLLPNEAEWGKMFGASRTAIREAIAGMRRRFEGARLWAVFEPRSNTTRRRVFQDALAEALGCADGVCIAAVARADKLAEEERLDTDLLMKSLRDRGLPAFYEPDADAIVDRLEAETKGADVVIVFSNGGFGGIHDKLLNRL